MTTYGHLVSETQLDLIDDELGDRYSVSIESLVTYPEGSTQEDYFVVVLPSVNETMFSSLIFELPDSPDADDLNEALGGAITTTLVDPEGP